jgi:hypothetical protein
MSLNLDPAAIDFANALAKLPLNTTESTRLVSKHPPCYEWPMSRNDSHEHCPVCHAKAAADTCPYCGHRGEMVVCVPSSARPPEGVL